MNVSESPASSLMVAEEVKPVRTGSLPFKKRRFPSLDLVLSNQEPGQAEDLESVAQDTDKEEEDIEAPSAERIAALALMAAAASSVDANAVPAAISRDNSTTSGTTASTSGETNKHGFSFYRDTGTETPTLNSALVAAAAELQNLHHATQTTLSDSSNNKRIHKPPLMSPLPNGCHGRTSRNNSYCRRAASYNGSKYCKLHYQHCLASGAATEEELMGGMVVEVGDMPEAGPDGTLGGSQDGTTKGTGAGLNGFHHQDKRYTGAAFEVRCKATTTRGRDCSYCAVNGTRYCFLHADYEQNPPPRRGGVTSSGPVSKNKDGDTTSEATAGTAKGGKSGKADGSKRKSPSMSSRRLSTTKNLEKHMAHAPYPLLSTLSTDKWLHRKVIVSTGPLTNHVGLVEKWGNGWISVRLPGVGLHNRRSFELYLHPSPDSEPGTTGNSVEKIMPVVEVFETADKSKTMEKTAVERKSSPVETAATAEATSPPTPMAGDRPVLDTSKVHEVTPLTSCRVIGIEQSASKGKESERRMSSIMFPTSLSSGPTTVPESPVPEQSDAGSKGESKEKEPLATSAQADAQAQGDGLTSKFQLPVKSTADGASNEMPLVQSLLLAQGDRVAKHKLGLLFGTAALERGRRSVHKPVRYEDTELIAKKLKKRDRDADSEDAEEPVKRFCAEASPIAQEGPGSTPVISSSDEESSDFPASMVSV